MVKERRPAVAGLFYPSERSALSSMVDRLLREARQSTSAPKALIVPHAGYVYSGPVAASGFVSIQERRRLIRRVVLIGPSHRVSFTGIAATGVQEFSTPLGKVPVDQEMIEELISRAQVRLLDDAHRFEHCLEVELPFLQRLLEGFVIVPLLVGLASPEEVAAVLEVCWGGEETLVVVSSDLSHYHNYETAVRLDAETSRVIEELRYEDLEPEDACGGRAVSGLLYLARNRGLQARTLDLRNSGDTAGPRDAVVGYGAYAVV